MDKARSEPSDKRLMGGLVLVGVVVFAIAVGVGQLLGARPGTLADWIAATATVAALMAASYAGVQTSRTFRLEQKRDAQRDEDRRRQQAELVAVWAGMIESIGPQVTIKWELGKPAQQAQAAGVVYPTSIPVTIRNASALPVYAMTIDIYFGDPNTEVPVLGGRYEVQDEVRGLAVFGTIEGIEVATPDLVASMVSVLETLPGPHDKPRTVSIGCSFKDNAGLRWRRNPGGRLEPDDQPRLPNPEIHSPVDQTPAPQAAQGADGALRRTSFLNGLAVGGPLDGAVVQVETGAPAMIRTMEVFVSPATLTVEPWSAYSYGQQIEDLVSSIKGRLPHRLVRDPPILPVDDRLELVGIDRARGRVVGGGPLDGNRIYVDAAVPGVRCLLVYVLDGDARDTAVWHAHIYRADGTYKHLGQIDGDPAPDTRRA